MKGNKNWRNDWLLTIKQLCDMKSSAVTFLSLFGIIKYILEKSLIHLCQSEHGFAVFV